MEKTVLVETSARHVHVDRKTLDILFGEGYELTHKKDLSQPVSSLVKREFRLLEQRAASPQFPFSDLSVPILRLSFQQLMHVQSA